MVHNNLKNLMIIKKKIEKILKFGKSFCFMFHIKVYNLPDTRKQCWTENGPQWPGVK